MQNVQDIFETCKQSFISAFSICMTVPLTEVSDPVTPLMAQNLAVITQIADEEKNCPRTFGSELVGEDYSNSLNYTWVLLEFNEKFQYGQSEMIYYTFY